jgi:hypothetical protein
LQGKAARIDFAAFFDKFADLISVVLVAGERFVAQTRKAALQPQCHTRTIQQDGGFEAFALQTGSLQQIDETYRSFKCDGVKFDLGLLAWLGFDVFKYFFFEIDKTIAFLMGRYGDCGHEILLNVSKKCPASEGWMQGGILFVNRYLIDGEYFTNPGKSETDSVYRLIFKYRFS